MPHCIELYVDNKFSSGYQHLCDCKRVLTSLDEDDGFTLCAELVLIGCRHLSIRNAKYIFLVRNLKQNLKSGKANLAMQERKKLLRNMELESQIEGLRMQRHSRSAHPSLSLISKSKKGQRMGPGPLIIKNLNPKFICLTFSWQQFECWMFDNLVTKIEWCWFLTISELKIWRTLRFWTTA